MSIHCVQTVDSIYTNKQASSSYMLTELYCIGNIDWALYLIM